jgi:energy-coupling factor transporter ATP-binding protein EcfA2
VNERTREFDLFLSYNRLDRRDVDRLAEALGERGLEVFKDDWYLRPGEPWPAALERNLTASRAIAVAVGRNGLGPWQQREMWAALDRQSRASKTDRPVPVIPVLLDQLSGNQTGLAFLLQNTWVEGWDPRAADLVAGAVRGKAPAELYDEAHPDPRTRICPYRGLGFFREEDAGFYFGREPDLERLTQAVDRHPLVAVVGASGSGKSSLVRAGLIPGLRRQTTGRVWQVADMRPGSDPFLALARELLPLREPKRFLDWSKGDIDDECERLTRRLESDGAEHLTHVVGQILAEEPGTSDLLLLVDQWEELYTYRPAEAGADWATPAPVSGSIRIGRRPSTGARSPVARSRSRSTDSCSVAPSRGASRSGASTSPATRSRPVSIAPSWMRRTAGAIGDGGPTTSIETRRATATRLAATPTTRRSTSTGSTPWPSAAGWAGAWALSCACRTSGSGSRRPPAGMRRVAFPGEPTGTLNGSRIGPTPSRAGSGQ